MDVNPDQAATPAQSLNNASYWKTEDSGYHTFTPSSFEYSELSHESLEPSIAQATLHVSGYVPINCEVTPEANFRLKKRYGWHKVSTTPGDSSIEQSHRRRGVKRTHTEDLPTDVSSPGCTATPTTLIAGGIQKLQVTDSASSLLRLSTCSVNSYHSNTSNEVYYNKNTERLAYPTTPVKKICRTSCKLSPIKRSGKKSSFTIHSLSCEANGIIKHRPHSKVVRTIQFRPDQKFDIIKMLYENRAMPPIVKILSYLSNEEISNFSLVSPLWSEVFKNYVGKAKKMEYKTYLMNVIENLENKDKGLTPIANTNQMRSLKEVHNVLNTCAVQSIHKSPPGTPRTNKFRKFTKSASLDSRIQLSCVRCQQPAKVTMETSGEEWGECTNSTCSYQFCRFCMCHRHPGKSCSKYDLEGPSPSKRKKSSCAVASKKSKRNLRRLMI